MESIKGLIVLVFGPPRVGKTSFSKELTPYLESKGYDAIHVEYDNYIQVGANHREGLYKKQRIELIERVGEILKSSNLQPDKKQIVILDDIMFLPSMRSKAHNFAESIKFGVLQIFLWADLELLKSRLAKSSNNVSEFSLDKIYEQLNSQRIENKWHAETLTFEYPKKACDFDLIIERIEHLLNAKIPKKAQDNSNIDREVCAASVVHQADIELRRIVSHKIKNCDKQKMPFLSKNLQAVKALVLKDIRTAKDGKLADLFDQLTKENFRAHIERTFTQYLENS